MVIFSGNDIDGCCKLILLGNGSVGKSSIIARFLEDGFSRVYKQTIGIDFFQKILILQGNKRLHLQVWDIGGQSINSKMLSNYIHGSQVIFLCYDVTDPQSFQDLNDWFHLVHQIFHNNDQDNQKKNSKLPLIYLIGNKVDLIHLRKISDEKHQFFVDHNQLDGEFLLSAQNGDRVRRCLYTVAGISNGMDLSEYELSFVDTVVNTSIVHEQNEGRTAIADQIELEDLALMNKKKKRCIIS